MRLGIDFGTTRIVAAAVDRGNYPVVSFDCPDGAVRDWLPPLVAIEGAQRWYGWEAWCLQGRPGVTVVRSLKRVLADAGPSTPLLLGGQTVPLMTALAEMTSHIRQQLTQHSSLGLMPGEPLEVLLGVPANANTNQRFLTVEAFRAAGFDVLGLLNEPSAASIEYAHRLGESESSGYLLVYDLGGGTFDVSLVERAGRAHMVIASEGIPTLGGDDFDELLAQAALDAIGRTHQELTANEEFLLAEECREKKESLHPNTRKVVLDLDGVRDGFGTASLPVADFYDHCRPLVDETLHATEDLLSRLPDLSGVTLYVTGGGSELPLVGRALREQFGRRVRRSAYTRSATAIGLAIQADAQTGYQLRERFTRHFGVWREADSGQRMIFDPLFEKGTALPAPGQAPLERSRSYRPVHNVGHFRYLECSHRAADGSPTGDITSWDEIRFPFDPALAPVEDLRPVSVGLAPAAAGHTIEERYRADSTGSVHVEIANLTAGYTRRYRLARWAASGEAIVPAKTRRRRKASA